MFQTQNTKTIIEITKEDFQASLEEFARKFAEKSFTEKFYNVLIDAKTAAKIHGISPTTFIRYVQRGLIDYESKKGKAYQFRLSEILRLNISELKYKRL